MGEGVGEVQQLRDASLNLANGLRGNLYRNVKRIVVASLCTVALSGADSATASQSVGIDKAKAVQWCNDPDYDDPITTQVRTMDCLINNVRTNPVAVDESLNESAVLKTKDIIQCGFTHYACDLPFDNYISEGFPRRGENLAYGRGPFGSAQSIFRAWMNSPTHRQNIMDQGWDRIGLSLQRVEKRNYWTTHFGDFDRK